MSLPFDYSKITVTKLRKRQTKYRFQADFINIPGSPLVGYGHTKASAIGDLILSHPEAFTLEFEDESE